MAAFAEKLPPLATSGDVQYWLAGQEMHISKAAMAWILGVGGLALQMAGCRASSSTNLFDHPLGCLGTAMLIVSLSIYAGRRAPEGPQVEHIYSVLLVGLVFLFYAAIMIWIAANALLSLVYAPFGLLALAGALFFARLTRALWRSARWSWYAAISLVMVTTAAFLCAAALGGFSRINGVLAYQLAMIVLNVGMMFVLARKSTRDKYLKRPG